MTLGYRAENPRVSLDHMKLLNHWFIVINILRIGNLYPGMFLKNDYHTVKRSDDYSVTADQLGDGSISKLKNYF